MNLFYRRLKKPVLALLLLCFVFASSEVVFIHVNKDLPYKRWVQSVLQSQLSTNKPLLIPNNDDDNPRLIVRLPEKNDAHKAFKHFEMGTVEISADVNESYIYPDSLEKNKTRVFIIGASAAYGFPHIYKDTFAAELSQKLSVHNCQVINAAVTGSPSWELVPQARKIAKYYKPDIAVIYCAYNDLVQWNMIGTSKIHKFSRKYAFLLSRSHLIAFFQYKLLKYFSENQEVIRARSDGLKINVECSGIEYALKHPFHKHTDYDINQWPLDKQRFIKSYARNNVLMSEALEKSGAEVIMMTSPVKYKLSPAWKHPQPEFLNKENQHTVHKILREAYDYYLSNDYNTALEKVDHLLQIEPYPPVINYLKGMCLEAMGKNLKARHAYETCQENMVGNLGGVISFNKEVEKVAEKRKDTLLDIKTVFDKWSEENKSYFNNELIVDDCHPSKLGHKIIAEELFKIIRDKI